MSKIINNSNTLDKQNELLEKINEIKNKIDMEIFKNANQTKHIINNQNQLRDTRIIFLMFIAVIVLLIANLFK